MTDVLIALSLYCTNQYNQQQICQAFMVRCMENVKISHYLDALRCQVSYENRKRK